MKKGMWLLLVPALLTGCAGGTPDTSPAVPVEVVPAISQAAEPVQEDGGLSATQLEDSPRPMTEEEILTLYHRAEEACGWFELAPLPDTGETLRVDGVIYRKVDFPGMADVEDLRTYLRSLFSTELTDQLLSAGGSHPLYRDIDGALYVSAAGRSRDPGKGAVQVEIRQLDSLTYSLEVAVDLLGGDGAAVTGLECWSFPFVFVDGRWVFTDFRLVY